jgi:PilZ domain
MRRLHEDAIVTLGFIGNTHSFVQNVDCIVLAISGRTASLHVLDMAAWQRMPKDPGQVYMTFTHLNALVSLRGRLSIVGEEGEVRFAVTDDAHVKRGYPTRAKVALPLKARRPGTSEEFPGTTVDISTNGLMIESAMRVAVGDLIDCALALPNRPGETPVRGKVVKAAEGSFALTMPNETVDVDTKLALFELVTARRRAEWRARNASVAEWSPHDL